MKVRGGLGVHLVQRRASAAPAPPPIRRSRTSQPGPARTGPPPRRPDRLVQRRHRQRLPQPGGQLRPPARARCSHCETVESPAACTAPVRRNSRRARSIGPASRRMRQPVAPRHRVPVEHGGQQVERRGQRRTLEHRAPAERVDARRSAATAGPARGPWRRCAAGTRTSRGSSRTGRAGRCPRSSPVARSVKAVARPPRLRPRVEDEDARPPGRQSRRAALRPAKPAPMTMTSAKPCAGRPTCRAPPRAHVAAAISARRGRGIRTTEVKTS